MATIDRKLGHLWPCWKQHNCVFLTRFISSHDCGNRNEYFKPKTWSFPNPKHIVFVPKPTKHCHKKNWELNPKKREVATKGNLKFHHIGGLTELYSCALSLNICLSKQGKRNQNSVAIDVRLKRRFKQANYSCCNVTTLSAPFTSKLQIFSLALMWRSADGEVTLMVLRSKKEVVSYQQEVWQYYLRRSLVQQCKCYPPLCPLTCYQTAELQRLVDQLISQWKKNPKHVISNQESFCPYKTFS